jgi:hypothetical protein
MVRTYPPFATDALIEMFLYPKGALLIIAFNAHTMAGNLTVWESAVKRQVQILVSLVNHIKFLPLKHRRKQVLYG